MVFFNSIYTLVLCFFRAGALSLIFFILNGFPPPAQIYLTLIIFVLHIIAMYGIGLLCAAYSLLFRQNNILQSFFILGVTFFSSAFIPNEAYMEIIQNISIIFPSTSSIEAIRNLIGEGNIDNSYNLLTTLFLQSVLYVIMGIITFKTSIYYAKKHGSINFF